MKLYGTPLSHFTRKVRLLLDLYDLRYEFIDVGNVATGKADKFGGNPLARVPVLQRGSDWLLESDHIAEFIVRNFDPADQFGVLDRSAMNLNIRAVLNGIMLEEVTQILAKRTGVPVEQYSFFESSKEAISRALDWLEENADQFSLTEPSYRNLHLVCAWEHLEYYGLVALSQQKLAQVVQSNLNRPSVRKTSPAVLKPRK